MTADKVMGEDGPPKTTTVTATEHDNIELRKMGQKHVMTSLMVTFIHFKFDVVRA